MKIAFANKAASPRWEKTPDGFLRCHIRVLAERVMDYDRSEIVDPPPGSGPIRMLVRKADMAEPESIRSLEGAIVVAGDHTWLTPELVRQHGVGNVAGTPRLDGDYLICDLLVTDPETIRAIEAGELPEISAAYTAETLFEPGVFDSASYDALQTRLRFNHIALIRAGYGRAGRDVKILNVKGEKMKSSHFENGRKKALAYIENRIAAAKSDEKEGPALRIVNTTLRQRSPLERLGFTPSRKAEARRLQNTGEAEASVRRTFARVGSRKIADPLAERRRIQNLMDNSAVERAEYADRVAANRRAQLRRLGFQDPKAELAQKIVDALD